MKVQTFYGAEIKDYVDDLARLRIEVFREFPYLYEGNMEYEKKYLEIYPDNPESILVAVFDEHHHMIGASTAMPLKAEADYVKEPFIKNGYDIDSIYYFAESVLVHAFRGHGFGHRFFENREQAAKKFGYNLAAFCAVEREETHPKRPADFHPLDEFWSKKGFVRHPELQSTFSWPDLGEKTDSKKLMTYWLKSL